MTTKEKALSKRHASQAWAAAYQGLAGDVALPTMPRRPLPGYAWDSQGREVPLVRAWVRCKATKQTAPTFDDLLGGIEVGDRTIITEMDE